MSNRWQPEVRVCCKAFAFGCKLVTETANLCWRRGVRCVCSCRGGRVACALRPSQGVDRDRCRHGPRKANGRLRTRYRWSSPCPRMCAAGWALTRLSRTSRGARLGQVPCVVPSSETIHSRQGRKGPQRRGLRAPPVHAHRAGADRLSLSLMRTQRLTSVSACCADPTHRPRR
jgi:hypothetical protein